MGQADSALLATAFFGKVQLSPLDRVGKRTMRQRSKFSAKPFPVCGPNATREFSNFKAENSLLAANNPA